MSAYHVVFDVGPRRGPLLQDFMKASTARSTRLAPATWRAAARNKVYEGDWQPRRIVVLEFVGRRVGGVPTARFTRGSKAVRRMQFGAAGGKSKGRRRRDRASTGDRRHSRISIGPLHGSGGGRSARTALRQVPANWRRSPTRPLWWVQARQRVQSHIRLVAHGFRETRPWRADKSLDVQPIKSRLTVEEGEVRRTRVGPLVTTERSVTLTCQARDGGGPGPIPASRDSH